MQSQELHFFLLIYNLTSPSLKYRQIIIIDILIHRVSLSIVDLKYRIQTSSISTLHLRHIKPTSRRAWTHKKPVAKRASERAEKEAVDEIAHFVVKRHAMTHSTNHRCVYIYLKLTVSPCHRRRGQIADRPRPPNEEGSVKRKARWE